MIGFLHGRQHVQAVAAVIIALVANAIVRADLIVNSWDLRTHIVDDDAGQQYFSGTTQIQNPMSQQFATQHLASTCLAYYQVTWASNDLSLGLDSTLHADTLRGAVNSFGFMNVTLEFDSILSLDSVFQYSIPTQPARASSGFSVTKTNPTHVLYNNSQVRTNFTGPPSGTLVANADIFLLAGQTYRIQWSFGIIHFDPAIPGAASNGTGSLSFNIHPVPEPATLAPLAIAALLLRKPRRSPTRGALMS